MPKPLTTTLSSVYGSVAEDLKQRIGNAQAAQAGPPIASGTDGVEPATDAERLKLWNAPRPEATDQAMAQLAAERYAAHRAAGFDETKAIKATAEDLTHFRYAGRIRVYTYGQVGFKEQVAEATRMAKLAARKSTPDPPAPPPTMKSAALTGLETTGGVGPAGREYRPADDIAADSPDMSGLVGPTPVPGPLSQIGNGAATPPAPPEEVNGYGY